MSQAGTVVQSFTGPLKATNKKIRNWQLIRVLAVKAKDQNSILGKNKLSDLSACSTTLIHAHTHTHTQ